MSTKLDLQFEISQLKAENAALRSAVYETLSMARRYADGRSTYAPGMVNAAIDHLISVGINVETDHTLIDKRGLYASDGMFGFWDTRQKRFFKDIERFNPEDDGC